MSILPDVDRQLNALASQLAKVETRFMAALMQTERKIMTSLGDLSTSLIALKADFEAYKAGVDAAVQAALANATAEQAPIIQALADQIAAIDAEVKGT